MWHVSFPSKTLSISNHARGSFLCKNERSFFSPCQLAKFFPAQKVQKKQSKRCILSRLNCLNIEAYRGTCKSDYSPVLLCHHQTIHLLSPSYTYISNAPQGRAIISLPLLQASQRKKGGGISSFFSLHVRQRKQNF